MSAVGLITNNDPKSPVSEAFRTLRTNIQFSSIDKEIRTIVITSSKPGEGKSTVAANLAISISQEEKRVLLIDCDMRKPTVHKVFNIRNIHGLTNILMGNKELSDMDHKFNGEASNLSILPSGPIPPNPSELLGSNRMKSFLEQVKLDYDMVILDSPPIGLVTDSAILSTLVDGTILVVAAGQVEVEVAKRSRELLDKVNANIIGVVLNKIPITGRGSYKYSYYQYDTYYGEQSPKNDRRKGRRI